MLGKNHTEVISKLISQALKGVAKRHTMTKETRLKVSKAHLNNNHTEETKRKISTALKGRNHTKQVILKLKSVKKPTK